MSKSRFVRPDPPADAVVASRTELFDAAETAESDAAELERRYRDILADAVEIAPATEPAAEPAADEPADEPDEFEFNLFSTSAAATVKLDQPAEDPLLDLMDPLARQAALDAKMYAAYVPQQRPDSYYRQELSAQALAEIAEVAVSGDDIVAQSTQRYRGMERPWRVIHVDAKHRVVVAGRSVVDKKHRPNQKRREMLRKRQSRDGLRNSQKLGKQHGWRWYDGAEHKGQKPRKPRPAGPAKKAAAAGGPAAAQAPAKQAPASAGSPAPVRASAAAPASA
ncbi:uncharacterized protein V1510DRAFT_396827 [Dipodascopsis tothii]|uniref:uncharacterized protein n=1 Tax=Dipodascopsis tothii TaxID=44089 RepID=UPI0034CD9809